MAPLDTSMRRIETAFAAVELLYTLVLCGIIIGR